MTERDLLGQLADTQATAHARRQATGSQDLTVDALPTVYRGTQFRSALEASWAATLDSYGITWLYEPQLVTLPSGVRYLPDFHLPALGTWIEVKGDGVPRVEKAFEFGAMLACSCPRLACTCRWPGGELVLVGHPPRQGAPGVDERYAHWPARALRRLTWRTHHMRWTSTRGRAAWFTRCADCDAHGWFDAARCRACRGPLAGAHGHQPGADEVSFVRVTGPAVDDEGAAA